MQAEVELRLLCLVFLDDVPSVLMFGELNLGEIWWWLSQERVSIVIPDLGERCKAEGRRLFQVCVAEWFPGLFQPLAWLAPIETAWPWVVVGVIFWAWVIEPILWFVGLRGKRKKLNSTKVLTEEEESRIFTERGTAAGSSAFHLRDNEAQAVDGPEVSAGREEGVDQAALVTADSPTALPAGGLSSVPKPAGRARLIIDSRPTNEAFIGSSSSSSRLPQIDPEEFPSSYGGVAPRRRRQGVSYAVQ